MAAIKLHAYTGSDDGSESCDFRGDKKIGHAQGDEHTTLFEIDPATDDQIEFFLENGPLMNAYLSQLKPATAVLGSMTHAGLRIGVWDE